MDSRIRIHHSSFVASSAVLEIVHAGHIQIGQSCKVHEGVIIKTYGGRIEIGNQVSLNPYCVVYGHGGLTIGNGVQVAAHTIFIPSNHNFDRTDVPIHHQGETMKGIVVEDDVWIGSGVKVLDGVTIGKGCVIGAGSVVNRSTEPYGIYVGVPARFVRSRLS